MAIYNIEYMNESTTKNDDLIDSMLEMCNQMMDVLDEHGGARNKYVKMKDKEANKNLTLAQLYQAQSILADSDKAKKNFNSKVYDHAIKMLDAGDKVATYTGKNDIDIGDGTKFIHNHKSENDISNSREGKKRFMKDFGGPSSTGKKLGHDKPGEIKALQDKKRAIKETCLNILSFIDEL